MTLKRISYDVADEDDEILPGDFLETTTGRMYMVVESTKSPSRARFYLGCVVVTSSEALDVGATYPPRRVFPLRWHKRDKVKRRPSAPATSRTA